MTVEHPLFHPKGDEGDAGARRWSQGVTALAVLHVLDALLIAVALPTLQGAFGISLSTAGWVLTVYLCAEIACLPLAARATHMWGRERTVYGAAALLGSASLLCAWAPTFEGLLIGRVLQGAAGSALIPLSQAIVLDVTPVSQRARALIRWGMALMLGPIFAPIIGGWLVAVGGWSAVFWAPLPLLGLGVAWMRTGVPVEPLIEKRRTGEREGGETRKDTGVLEGAHTRQPFDIQGWIAFTAWTLLTLVLWERGRAWGLWEQAGWMHVAWIGSTTWLLLSFTRTQHAFPPFFLWRDRSFAIACFFICIANGILYGLAAAVPAFLQHVGGWSPLHVGWLLWPRGAGTLLAMAASLWLLTWWTPRTLLAIGWCLLAFSVAGTSGWTLHPSPSSLMIWTFIQGAGIGLAGAPLTALAYATLKAEWRTEATTWYAVLRTLGGACGIAATLSAVEYQQAVAASLLTAHTTEMATRMAVWSKATGFLDVWGGASLLLLFLIPLAWLFPRATQHRGV